MATMRSAPDPSRRKIGIRSRNAMSSSMVMLAASLRHQFVAAGFGDQDGGRGGVLLDLMAQAINVGFERVGGDAGIVAPNLPQQGLARHRPLPGAIEVAQDRGLLLGQADLVALGIEQEL